MVYERKDTTEEEDRILREEEGAISPFQSSTSGDEGDPANIVN